MATLLINGTLGFAMLIATLFSMGDLDAALEESPAFPYMAIFRRAVGSVAGAVAMSSIIIVMIFVSATGVLTSTSRVYFALARDQAIPGWRFLKKTSPRTKIPANAVLVTVVIAAALSLINIGDNTAFNGVISVSIAGLFGSYLVPSSLLLYRRLTGGIQETAAGPADALANTANSTLVWGPWRLRGILGVANNAFTCVYLVYVLFFSFWPASRNVTPQTMNWAFLATTVIVTLNIVYYLLWAKNTYKGPLVEVDREGTNGGK